MKYRSILSALTLLAVFGCTTSRPVTAPSASLPAKKPAPRASESRVGANIGEVLATAKGLRTEIFGPDGKKLDAVPQGTRGSVSVHTAGGQGQDNYTFDEQGKITKHLRSYWSDYSQGVWKEVK